MGARRRHPTSGERTLTSHSRGHLNGPDLVKLILNSLEDDKAEDIVSIDLHGKTSIADDMIVASGRSQRHVGAVAEHLVERLKEAGERDVRIEGMPHCDWVLIDAGDAIVHIFRPEVREFYKLEKLWAADVTAEGKPVAAVRA
jgi:ribosome-associated protein